MRRSLALAFALAATGLSAPAASKRPARPAAPAPVPAPAPAPAPAPVPAPVPEAEPPRAAATASPAADAPARAAVDLDALSAEYQSLRDELFRSRAKTELLGAALFKTRLLATFQYKAQRAWPLKRVSLRIDDQPVYSADAPTAEDPIKLFEGFASPGRHTVSLRVEATGQGEGGGAAFAAEASFTVEVQDGKEARLALVADESGDGPRAIARDHKGEFDVRLRARLKQAALGSR